MPSDDVKANLRRTLLGLPSSGSPGETAQTFFRTWFRPHFVLFRKNLSRTNLQFAELFALLKMCCRDSQSRHRELQFVARTDFLSGFGRLLEDLAAAYQDQATFAAQAATMYCETFRSIVVVEPFFGSCSVFLPPHLELDSFGLCAQAGYVHSLGANLYTRSFDQVSAEGLKESIRQHVATLPPGERQYLTVYAHEDFTPHDRQYASELVGGLDDSKLHVDKYYVGEMPLVRFLDSLKADPLLKERLVVAGPGNYREARDRAKQAHPDLSLEQSIWLVIDRGIGSSPQAPGQERYLICYAQTFKNHSPFQYFDENKPAWVAHTTIPHSMAAAMLNVARPWLPAKSPRIADPFAGSGTILLEALRIRGAAIYCGELEGIACLAAADNLAFFSQGHKAIADVAIFLQAVKEGLSQTAAPGPRAHARRATSPAMVAYNRVIEVYDRLAAAPVENELVIGEATVEELRDLALEERLLFYLCLRARMRHFGGLERGAEDWGNAFIRELHQLLEQMVELRLLREREEKIEGRTDFHEDGAHREIQGGFSRGCTVSAGGLKAALAEMGGWKGVRKRDARKNTKLKVDLVITDPPYGFNTKEDTAKLAHLYYSSLRVILATLSAGGQLILVLPEQSFTGRKLAAFSAKGWVAQQVLAAADACGLDAVTSSEVLPAPGSFFRPPYYWESERALRRAILCFRFRPREARGGA